MEDLKLYTDNKEWQLVKSPEASKKNNTYPGFEQFYPDITFTFNLQRSSPSYRAGVILPCLVTMLLVLSTFLLPPSAGDKLLVNTGCFLGERRALLTTSSLTPCFSVCSLPPPLPVNSARHVRPHPSHSSLLQQHGGSGGHRHSPQYLLYITHQGEKVHSLEVRSEKLKFL